MDKLSLTSIKQKNFSDVYHFIYKNNNTSKQAIALGLSMSLPTVSQHLNTLLEENLIQKCGQLESQIGRKAVAYSIIPDARISIGAEILKDKVNMTAINLKGELIAYQPVALPFEDSDTYYEQLCKRILKFIDKQSFSKQQILGVTFAVQGLVSSDKRSMVFDKILDMHHISADTFEKYLGCPCSLCHDSEGAALNTIWHRPSIKEAIYLSISNHLGGAVIINGEIQHGKNGKTGTMEHMTLYPFGKKCYCGQSGCAECYCSVDSLLKDDEDLKTFFKRTRQGEPEYMTRWQHFLNDLALFLNNIHLVIDNKIILGGHISVYLKDEDFDYLHQRIREITAFPESDPFVIPGIRMDHEIPIGAALERITEFLDSI